jgi:hypothetical protein
MVPYITAAETTLPSYTVTFVTLVGSGFAMGELVLSLEAYLLREWKKLQVKINDLAFILRFIFFTALAGSVCNAKL